MIQPREEERPPGQFTFVLEVVERASAPRAHELTVTRLDVTASGRS